MTWIDVARGLLVALRRHLRRIRCAWYAARTELLALDIIL
jgi:hypothetical protein